MYSAKIKNNKKSVKKILATIVAAVILLVVTLLILEKTGVTSFYNKPDGSDGDSYINYNPPTEEEQQSGDNEKEEIVRQEKNSNNSQDQTLQGTTKVANVIITDAGQYDDVIEVRSFIPDHYQDGTCTITFTQGTKKVQKSTPAYRDVSTTICTNPLFTRAEFPSGGGWQVVVIYSSEGAQGASEAKTINIQ